MSGRKKKKCSGRRGALMMMLMVAMVVGGVVALRLLPQEDIIARREKESELHSNLSQIREAFDLKLESDPDWDPDLSSKTGIENAIASLTDENFLREKSLTDPTVPTYLWGTSANYYWRASINIASNSSFEIEDPVDPTKIAYWLLSPGTVAASDSYYPNDSSIDDYPHQNKLGQILRNSGSSLRITK